MCLHDDNLCGGVSYNKHRFRFDAEKHVSDALATRRLSSVRCLSFRGGVSPPPPLWATTRNRRNGCRVDVAGPSAGTIRSDVAPGTDRRVGTRRTEVFNCRCIINIRYAFRRGRVRISKRFRTRPKRCILRAKHMFISRFAPVSCGG